MYKRQADEAEAATALDLLRRLIAARGSLEQEGKLRLARVETLLGEKLPSSRSRRAASV